MLCAPHLLLLSSLSHRRQLVTDITDPSDPPGGACPTNAACRHHQRHPLTICR